MADVWADADAGPDRDCRFYVSLYRRTAATAVAAAAASSCAVAARDTQFLVEAVGELGVDVHSMQVQVCAAHCLCVWRRLCSPALLWGGRLTLTIQHPRWTLGLRHNSPRSVS